MDKYRVYTRTERSRGGNHPRNEDAHLYCECSFMGDLKLQLMVVADGLGGLSDGDVASRNGVRGFASSLYNRLLKEYLDWDVTLDSAAYHGDRMKEIVQEAIRDANHTVCTQTRDPLLPTGTTLSVVLLAGQFGIVANVGDSPVYLYRARERKLRLISQLQTKAERDAEEGLYERYSPEYYSNDHIVCHILGEFNPLEENAIYSRLVGDLKPGDMILAGTDGSFGRMMEDEIQSFLEQENPEHVLELLFRRARQDKNDDQTAILCIKDAPAEDREE